MKTIIGIYLLAVITGLVSVGYVNSSINSLLVTPPTVTDGLQVTPAVHGNSLYVSPQLQGGSTFNSRAIQGYVPADKLQGNEGENFDAGVAGSQEAGDTLQPALGYGALNWVLQ